MSASRKMTRNRDNNKKNFTAQKLPFWESVVHADPVSSAREV